MPTISEKFIRTNGVEIYDRVKLSINEMSYEGVILPKHSFSGDDIVVLKLDNGYNIGISIIDAEIEILSKAKKGNMVLPKKQKRKDLPDVSVLGTGGTIASFVDYKTGAVSPAITAEQLVNSVKALDKIANIDAEPLYSLASEDMAPKNWEGIAKKIKDIHDSKNHGIIVTHGTDTMSYSASALAFQLPKISNPVVLTGAQRSPDRPSSDAHLNLVGSAKVAMTDLGEIAIAMHETTDDENIAIWRGVRSRKAHSSRRDAFSSMNEGPLGMVQKDVKLFNEYRPTSEETRLEAGFNDNATLIWSHPGLQENDWEKMTEGKEGVVIAGTGLGHIKSDLLGCIGKTAKDIPVTMTTQCLSGSTNLNVYRNGRELIAKGVIEGHDMLPETALVKTMWLLKNRNENIRELIGENLVGEIANSRKLT